MQERSVEALSRGSALIGGRFPGNRGSRPSCWGHDVRFRSRKLRQRYCSFNFHLHHADYGLARPIWTQSAARGSRQAMTFGYAAHRAAAVALQHVALSPESAPSRTTH